MGVLWVALGPRYLENFLGPQGYQDLHKLFGLCSQLTCFRSKLKMIPDTDGALMRFDFKMLHFCVITDPVQQVWQQKSAVSGSV